MLHINKSNPPRSFIRHQKAFNAEFSNIPKITKLILKKSLLHEQGFLCAYCMTKIDCNNMKIEHWRSQKKYLFFQLSYSNLFAVCKGNEGNPLTDQYCDTKKGNQDIKYNPADQTCHIESQVKYSTNGRISSDDPVFDDQLNNILGLNCCRRLTDNRKKLLDSITKTIATRKDIHTIQTLIHKWSSIDSKGHKKEYCSVALYFLQKHLSCRA